MRCKRQAMSGEGVKTVTDVKDALIRNVKAIIHVLIKDVKTVTDVKDALIRDVKNRLMTAAGCITCPIQI